MCLGSGTSAIWYQLDHATAPLGKQLSPAQGRLVPLVVMVTLLLAGIE